MRNITIIVLSVALAAAIISGLILYQRHLDTKNSLLISEKSLSELNEKVTQVNQETSTLQDQIRKNSKQLMELKSAKDSIAKLENAIKIKDQRLSELKEKIHTFETNLQEERKTNDAVLTDLQERLQVSQSHIRYLEEEVAKGHNKIQEFQGQLIDVKGQKSLAETKKDQLKSTYEALIADLKKEIKNQEVTIKTFKDQISVTFVDRILYEFGKATITPEGGKVLKKVGEILKNVQGKQIRVIGHTDNIPIMPKYRYKFPTNWELSASRSSAVIRYLQKNIHLDPGNLEAVGRSFYEPVASNETREGRAQNRRVEIIISPKLK